MSHPDRPIEVLLAHARRLGVNVAALVQAAYEAGRSDGFEECREKVLDGCRHELVRLEQEFDRLTPRQAAELDRTYAGITATPTAAAYFGSAADQLHMAIDRVARMAAGE